MLGLSNMTLAEAKSNGLANIRGVVVSTMGVRNPFQGVENERNGSQGAENINM